VYPSLSPLPIPIYICLCLQSVTFSNHWSLVTGLYPESHGIVGNEFFDPELNDTFYYKDPARSWDSKWWFGEPIWATSVLQNKKSAVMMWPGSDTKIENTLATYHIPYSTNYTTLQKAETILNWIDLPRDQRPQMMNMYIPQVDSAGHAQGPNGKRVSVETKTCTKFAAVTDLLYLLLCSRLTIPWLIWIKRSNI
jgi:predicted AlkP superfamily pyrophosphatase or phosphodiesterase